MIEKRFFKMIENGFIEEVEFLLQTYGADLQTSIQKAVGYRQIIAYLKNQSSKEKSFSEAILATQQLVKRQITWTKKFEPDIKIQAPFTPCLEEEIHRKILDQLQFN